VLAEREQADLVRKAKRGDAAAIETLVRAYLSASYAVALAVVKRPHDAEDIAQDAFVRALERLSTCREEARFGGWLLQIVRNQSRNHLSWRKIREVEDELAPVEHLSSGESSDCVAERKDLLRGLEGLNLLQREVILLHDLEGWTHPEIAKALDISPGMSRQHLLKARRHIRAMLDGKKRTNEVIHERPAN
jgi:RNA polymerase sigma-70 factor (ECF subfamily)